MLFLLAVWTGLEPATPCVTGMYSNQLNYQTKKYVIKNKLKLCFILILAVWTGLEPATPCVTGMYSNQLNYQTSTLLLRRCANIAFVYVSAKIF